MATKAIFEGAGHVAWMEAGRWFLSYGYHKIVSTGKTYTIEYYYGSSNPVSVVKRVKNLTYSPEY